MNFIADIYIKKRILTYHVAIDGDKLRVKL
jgi:hypothetical protein